MLKILSTALLAAAVTLPLAAPVSALEVHPVRTAKRTIDLGVDTAKGAFRVAKGAVTFDNCKPGQRWKDREGHWHRCRR